MREKGRELELKSHYFEKEKKKDTMYRSRH